jgi:hypothetical protein
MCLACGEPLSLDISAFCFLCKTPNPPNRTSGNRSLDSFIEKSWDNVRCIQDNYLQWIDSAQLRNVDRPPPDYECEYIADWVQPSTDEDKPIEVMLKRIVDEWNIQTFDFNKVNITFHIYIKRH